MNGLDLLNKIYNFQSDEEIEKFVLERLNELEKDAEDKVVGQGFTDIYRGFIGKKTHFKAGGSVGKFICPDLDMDYITPYVNVIRELKKMSEFDILYLLSIIFYELNELSPLGKGDVGSRTAFYFDAAYNSKKVSLKDIFNSGDAYCSERSALAHNIFKVIGIDSEIVIGFRDLEPHAYNVIFKDGYDKEPMILFDCSHFVSFISNKEHNSCAYFMGMKENKYNELISGNPFKPEMDKTERYYRHKFGFDEKYTFEAEIPKYIVGINNNPNKEYSFEDLNYLAHNENGVETVGSNKVMR